MDFAKTDDKGSKTKKQGVYTITEQMTSKLAVWWRSGKARQAAGPLPQCRRQPEKNIESPTKSCHAVGMDTIEFEGQTLHRWTVGASTYLAIPERGARLLNWHIDLANGTTRDVIHWPANADWSAIGHIRGGNPILFPFVARSFVDGKIGWWKSADGKVRPMPLHGYARDGTFALDQVTPHGFIARFEPGDACQEAYPFHYDFTVEYRFTELALRVELRLHNRDTIAIPWCAGHHFYFTLPWHPDLTEADYRIEIPGRKAFRHAADGHLDPQPKIPACRAFNDPSMIDRIITHLKSNEVRFGPAGGEEDITIRIGEDSVPSKWTSVVTWKEKPDSPYFCVEPWMGPPNAPEHKKGLHLVEPGESQSFRVEVSLL